MGGFGFFLDGMIRSIVKDIRRIGRASAAEDWPTADGKVTSFTGQPDPKHIRAF